MSNVNIMQKTKLLAIAIATFLSAPTMMAQNGKVLMSTNNSSILGASVSVLGKDISVTTNENGEFNLKGANIGDSIRVSYVGMGSKILPLTRDMIVYLGDKNNFLNEVVIEAYGTSSKRSLMGAISTVDNIKIEDTPSTNFIEAIDGEAGVQSYYSNGQPGTSGNVIIRGISTINGSTAPLYIVNGNQFSGSISDIDKNDIKSISVLKDAAACALYGNRAANGVILITLRNGSNSKYNLRVNVEQGIYSRAIPELDYLGANEFMEANWQGYRNSLITGGASVADASAKASSDLISTYLKYNIYNAPSDKLFDANGKLNAGLSIKEGYRDDLDWFKPLVRNGYRQEYNISHAADNKLGDHYLSLSYHKEDGYMKNSNFDRINGTMAINFNSFKWVTGGMSMSANYQESDYMRQTENTLINPFNTARRMGPIYPVHLHDAETGEYVLDVAGNKIYDDGLTYGRPTFSNRNVVKESEDNKYYMKRLSIMSNAFVDIHPMKDLTISLQGFGNLHNEKDRLVYGNEIGEAAGLGSTYHYDYTYKNYSFMQQIRWNHTFNSIHHLELLAGHENYNYTYGYEYASMNSQSFENNDEFANYSTILGVNGYLTTSRTESYLARAKYSYLNRYFIEGNYRHDGSSRFDSKNRWGDFGSVSASWIMSDEAWMKDIDALNYMKLRASYGEMGNDRSVAENTYNILYLLTRTAGNGASFITQNASENLKWEAVRSWGFAVDAKLWNRLDVSAEYFDKRSKDLIFSEKLALSEGLIGNEIYEQSPSRTVNFGSVSNRGVEISLKGDIIRSKDWTWNMGLNITTLSNKIISLPEKNRESGLISNYQKVMEGHSLNEWWLPQYVGVDRTNGNALYLLNVDDYYLAGVQDPVEGKAAIPASAQADIKEINGVYYTCNPNTTYVKYDFSGSAIPKMFGSISTKLSWRSLSLSMLATYSIGGKVYDAPYQEAVSAPGTSITNMHSDLANAWTVEDAVDASATDIIDANGVPAINYTRSQYNNATSTRFLTDASYFMLKNVTLKYSLPQSLISKIGLNNITLRCSAENLFMITSRKGMNPLQSYDGYCSDKSVTSRIISFGLTISI